MDDTDLILLQCRVKDLEDAALKSMERIAEMAGVLQLVQVQAGNNGRLAVVLLQILLKEAPQAVAKHVDELNALVERADSLPELQRRLAEELQRIRQ